MKTEQTLSLT